jgi:hypothetical protein
VGGLETLARGVHSDFEEPGTLVVEDERAYERLWERLRDAGPRPAVDFGRETVVVAMMGQKPTGGYGIEITGVDPLTTAEHGPDGFAIQALTSPYHVVRGPSR